MLNTAPTLRSQLPRILAVEELINRLEEAGLDKDDFVVRYPHSAMFCNRQYAFVEPATQVNLSCVLDRKAFMEKYKITPAFLKTKGIEVGFAAKAVDYIVREDFKVEAPDDQKVSRILFDLFGPEKGTLQ